MRNARGQRCGSRLKKASKTIVNVKIAFGKKGHVIAKDVSRKLKA